MQLRCRKWRSLSLAHFRFIVRSVNEIRRVKTGMRVSDIGNRPIGQIEDVRGKAFMVDVAGDGRMWLMEDALFSVDETTVTLVCAAGSINRYRIPTE